MKLRSKILIFFVLAAVSTAVPAAGEQDYLPDLALSVAWRSYQGPEILTLMVTPAGTGQFFNQARTPDGTIADGTIHLRLVDIIGVPINGFPREDVWLQDQTSNLAFCGIFELWPDSDTDTEGETSWFSRPQGGGYTNGSLQVYVIGSPLLGPTLPLRINSPDINGDLRVSLSDVVQFTQDYFGTYHFRSDLHHDSVLNLSDVVVLADHMGRSCTN